MQFWIKTFDLYYLRKIKAFYILLFIFNYKADLKNWQLHLLSSPIENFKQSMTELNCQMIFQLICL